MKEVAVLEVLEIYQEMVDQQNEVICRLGEVVKKQATELAHLRNMLGVEEVDPEGFDTEL